MIKGFILHINRDLCENEFEKLLSFTSNEKRDQIKKYLYFQDAQRTLLGDILVKNAIYKHHNNLLKNNLAFKKNAYGKPFLMSHPNIQFNISHAGRYVASAISTVPIGIDIELIKPFCLKIAERFFAPDETTYIMNGNRTHRFFEIWTKKESRIKWEGIGLHKPLSSFSVLDSTEQKVIFYHMIFDDGKAICHVCSQKKEKPFVEVINIDTLFLQINNTIQFHI